MTTKRYGRASDDVLGRLLQTLPGKLASHWLVQGMFYMDPTERRFKLSLDIAGALVLGSLLWPRVPPPVAVAAAVVSAHSLNFVFNGHIRGALKWHGVGGVTSAVLERELPAIAARLGRSSAVAQAHVFGSLARGELHDGSDLDIRILRRPGLRAATVACTLALLERGRSLWTGVPIDIYVFDSSARMSDMRSDEVPVDLTVLAASASRRSQR
jgi:predicted nucleotidyltransferase